MQAKLETEGILRKLHFSIQYLDIYHTGSIHLKTENYVIKLYINLQSTELI